MVRRTMLAALTILPMAQLDAAAQPVRDVSRAQLLYETHCVACHTTEVHWRDRKLARDWKSLAAEVGRWQQQSALGWSHADIDAVAAYLNALHYGFRLPD